MRHMYISAIFIAERRLFIMLSPFANNAFTHGQPCPLADIISRKCNYVNRIEKIFSLYVKLRYYRGIALYRFKYKMCSR